MIPGEPSVTLSWGPFFFFFFFKKVINSRWGTTTTSVWHCSYHPCGVQRVSSCCPTPRRPRPAPRGECASYRCQPLCTPSSPDPQDLRTPQSRGAPLPAEAASRTDARPWGGRTHNASDRTKTGRGKGDFQHARHAGNFLPVIPALAAVYFSHAAAKPPLCLFNTSLVESAFTATSPFYADRRGPELAIKNKKVSTHSERHKTQAKPITMSALSFSWPVSPAGHDRASLNGAPLFTLAIFL